MTAGDEVFIVLNERDRNWRLRCCQLYAWTPCHSGFRTTTDRSEGTLVAVG